MADVPGGTVTFLFTDVEGSTRLWEQYPDAMRQALARHDALAEAHVTAHGGLLVRPRGEGDSRFAVFTRASDAIAAAATLQQALHAEPWPDETPLRVRIAVHTGEADLREGDYYGSAVNRCARLRAIAHGGQTLLSQATYELVRETLPAGVQVRDLGEHRLKDLTRPERIFQVLAPDLPAAFPPLLSLDRHPHNLPVQLTPFIGREREVAAVRERLLDPQTHLLTLTGPGGTGKTRLALQVAAEVLDAFPAGVFFVNLAPITDPDLVLPTIAQTLGVREAGGQPLHETLHAFLQHKRLLLVLDNFEQVLDAASVVTEMLAACTEVRVLITSRAALHLRGERLYAVPPLALPDLTPPPPLETLTQYEAVRLFIERARDVQPDFTVTNATAPAVAEICVRLDGLPLALELAAARVRLFPPLALLARLGSRLTLLTGGPRDLPARQQTLRATIDWSYGLLTPTEQTLFARLAVFVGGCTLDTIEAICNPEGDLDVLEGVQSLVAKSLLRQEEGVEGEPRFVMLETLHEYARERLDASGAAEDLRRQHAVYFLELAEAAEPELRGPRQATWLVRLEQEHADLRAVMTWAQEQDKSALGLRLAGALWHFWVVRGHLSEGRRRLTGLLAQAGSDLPAGATTVTVRAKALRGAATLAYLQGDYGQAVALGEESLNLYRRAADKGDIAFLLTILGIVARGQGDYGRATALHDESVALSRELGDRWLIAFTLGNRGDAARQQGDYGRAMALAEEALALARELGDRWLNAWGLNVLGAVARDQGDHARATALLEESLDLHRELGDKQGIAAALSDLGIAAYRQGNCGQAVVLAEEALALARELEDKGGIAYSLCNLGEVAYHQGDYGRATALYAESLTLFRELGDKGGVAYGLEGVAAVACAQGQPERAARLWGAAAALREASGAPLAPAERPAYDRTVAAARAALGEDAFAAAWAAGQALSLEQAIAYALEEQAPA